MVEYPKAEGVRGNVGVFKNGIDYLNQEITREATQTHNGKSAATESLFDNNWWHARRNSGNPPRDCTGTNEIGSRFLTAPQPRRIPQTMGADEGVRGVRRINRTTRRRIPSREETTYLWKVSWTMPVSADKGDVLIVIF